MRVLDSGLQQITSLARCKGEAMISPRPKAREQDRRSSSDLSEAWDRRAVIEDGGVIHNEYNAAAHRWLSDLRIRAPCFPQFYNSEIHHFLQIMLQNLSFHF